MLKLSKYCLLFLIASCAVWAQSLMAAEGIKGVPRYAELVSFSDDPGERRPTITS
jgi:hypothetical protein